MSKSGEVLKEALQTARSEADILDALARRVEFVDSGKGEPEIPTVEALAAYLSMAPETARKEAGELLEQLPWPRMILDGILVKDGDLKRARWRARAPLAPRGHGQSVLAPRRPARNGRQVLAVEAVFGWHPSDDARFEDWDYGDPETEDKLTSLDGEDLDTAEVSADLNVEGVHELWRNADPQPRHPLAPLVRAWWKRPVEVEDRNDRADPLFPAPLVHVQRNDRRAGNLFSPAVWTATQESGQFDLFPGFGPGEANGPLVPALPLALYDLGKGTAKTRGRGAPLALRIFVEAVLSVPLHARTLNRPVALPPQRFGDLLKALYPNPGFYRPSRNFAAIYEAAKSLESARIPWEHPDGSGAMRRVVYARDLPRDGRLDDWVQFVVDLPPGSERGVLVDRTALRKAGVESAPSYRLALSLAFWWHDPGKMRTPIQRGGKGRGKLWRQTRQVERYPVVTDAELIAMTYPSEANNVGSTRRSRLQRSREALAFLIETGYANIATDRRILPGQNWAGWR